MPLLLEPDAASARNLRPVLGPRAEVVERPAELETRLERRTYSAVVLGPGLDLPAALATATRVSLQHPATTVVLVRDEISADVYAPALEAGVGAVVSSTDVAALQSALARAHTTWARIQGPGADDRRPGRVITVFAPKGGVGKTTMTVNLALALTSLGSRVCIVDLDLAFGDVAITLQLIPAQTLADAVGLGDRLDWSVLQGLVTEHPSGLSVLAAPTSPEGRERISATLVRQVVAQLRGHFDHVVVDTPPGFDEQVLGAFDETDDAVIMATLDVPTIKNVRVAVETLDLLDLVREPEHRHLVLNRADLEVGLTVAQVEGLLGMPVDVTLPSSIDVALATNNGDPIVSADPDHLVSRTILALARTLAGVEAVAEHAAAGRRGLFGRRRKETVR